MTSKHDRAKHAEYDAWLVDLDGTLYTQRWVRLAMAAELAPFGWSALPILKRFRREKSAGVAAD